MNPISVIELNNRIKDIISMNNDCRKVYVSGNITNVKLSRGHLYFTLKDDESSVNCAFWNCKLKTLPEDGMKINVWGNVTVYNKMGTYQISCYAIEIIGVKDDVIDEMEIYEQMGYFTGKQSLPKDIKNVGLITSGEGAAINDFRCVLEAGNFKGNIYFIDTLVQGVNCPASVVNNLQKLDTMNLDVIVITRGGGSKEDLIGFSNPMVLDAIHNTKTCVISAVGHENDTMYSDLVADVRAATPSVAAELICKSVSLVSCDDYINRINRKLDLIYKQRISKLDNLFRNKIDSETNYLSFIEKVINNKLDYEYTSRINQIDNLLKEPIKVINSEGVLIKSVNNMLPGNYKLVFIDGCIDIKI